MSIINPVGYTIDYDYVLTQCIFCKSANVLPDWYSHSPRSKPLNPYSVFYKKLGNDSRPNNS